MTEAIMIPRPGKQLLSVDGALSAAEAIRLDTWAVAIASEIKDRPPVADGDSFRIGTHGSLKLNPGGSWYDFEDGKGGRDTRSLIAHLLSCDRATALAFALEWLSTHEGVGPLSAEGSSDEHDELANIARVQATWNEGVCINDTPGAEYLQRERGLDLCQLNATEREQLRWIENARGDEGALAAAVTDSAGGELVGVQLTYVTGSGRGSEIKPKRRIYSGPLDWRARGLFRLEGNEERTFYLTEGLEDALSLRMAGYGRVGAVLGVAAFGLAKMAGNVTKVVIVRDDDLPWSPADNAVNRGVVRLAAQRLEVAVTPRPCALFPDEDHTSLKDANDVLRKYGVEGARNLIAKAGLKLGRIDAEPVIDELCRLDEFAFSAARNAAAEVLGMTQEGLKRAWSKRRKQHSETLETVGEEEGHAGHVEPHRDPQILREILDDNVRLFNRHLALPNGAAHVMALYAAISALYRTFMHALRLMFLSPEPDSGKSTAGDLLLACCQDGERTDSITPAALFRFIERWGGVIFINETDWNGAKNDDMQGLLNSGFESNGRYHRTEQTGDGQWVVKKYQVFAPLIFAGTKALRSQINSRCIIIPMEPALPPPLGPDIFDITPKVLQEAAELASRYVRWAQDHLAEVEAAIQWASEARDTRSPDDPVPMHLRNRSADKWRPLFIIAHLAGGPWPENILRAQQVLQPVKSLAELSLGVQLLFAIKNIFEAKPAKKQWPVEELQQALIEDRSSIWGEMPDTGKQVSLPCIASTLKKYGIVRRRPRNGVAENRPRVYFTQSFKQPFDRYQVR